MMKDKVRAELVEARKNGNMREIEDLTLILSELVHGTRWGSGRSTVLPEIKAARNRQAQRRWRRKVGYVQRRSPRVPSIQVGDYGRDPSGGVWRVDEIKSGAAWHHGKEGEPSVNCPLAMLALVAAPTSAAQPDVAQAIALADALYHACFDFLESEDLIGPERTALEGALRMYEVGVDLLLTGVKVSG